LGISKLIGLSVCAAMFAGHTGRSRIFESICLDGRTSNCHQALVIRSWCRLCLLVQILFWIEFAMFYPIVFTAPGEVVWIPNFPVIFGFGSVLLSWLILRPVLSSFLLRKDKEAEVTRLYSQPDFIGMQLSKAKKTDIGHFPFEVEIGPTDASVTLLQVINPFCRHCGKPLEEMMEIINSSRGKVKGIIRFLIDSADKNITASQKRLDRDVALSILKMASDGRKADISEALVGWFSNTYGVSRRFIKKWMQRYSSGVDDTDLKAEEMLSLHRRWTEASDIHSTPALFMNNLRLPPSMGFKDLKFFLLRLMSGQTG
jgi:hypothetical protein